jgi:hypothetical protein
VNVVTIHAKHGSKAIAEQARDLGGSLIVMPNAFNATNRELIIALAADTAFRRSIFGYGAQSGGLIGYGSDYAEQSPNDRVH